MPTIKNRIDKLEDKNELRDNDKSLIAIEKYSFVIKNISQLIVMLEGLRAMAKIMAYENSANEAAIGIWNQLNEFTRNKIVESTQKIDDSIDFMDWYDSIDREGKYHSKFLTEIENISEDPISQLTSLLKNESLFNLAYINEDDKKITLKDCKIVKYFVNEHKLTVKTPYAEYHILDENVIEIDII